MATMSIKTSILSNEDSLAVKHRPKYLEDLVGQDHIVKQIQGMFKSGKIQRVLLISGPTGSGKTTTAKIYSRYINCQRETICKGDNLCKSCQYLEDTDIDNHPDVKLVNIGNDTGVDNMRTIIQGSKFNPEFNYRVYILDEVHKASKPAKEALLVPLEPPPKKTVFILCTTNPELLPQTLVNRCYGLTVRPVKVETTAKLLSKIARKEKLELTKAIYGDISKVTRGHPRDAISALEKVLDYVRSYEGSIDFSDKRIKKEISETVKESLKIPNYELIVRFLKALYKGKLTVPLQITNMISGSEYDYFTRQLTEYHIAWMMNVVSKEKLNDYYYKDFIKSVEEYVDEVSPSHDLKNLELLLQLLLSTEERMKTYLLDHKSLVVNLIFSGATLFKVK